MIRGRITIEFTVWCAASLNQFPWQASYTRGGSPCIGFLQEANTRDKRGVAAIAKEAGWVLTRKYGWLCSRCKRQQPKEHV